MPRAQHVLSTGLASKAHAFPSQKKSHVLSLGSPCLWRKSLSKRSYRERERERERGGLWRLERHNGVSSAIRDTPLVWATGRHDCMSPVCRGPVKARSSHSHLHKHQSTCGMGGRFPNVSLQTNAMTPPKPKVSLLHLYLPQARTSHSSNGLPLPNSTEPSHQHLLPHRRLF